MVAAQKIRVRFAVDHDEQAVKITALLEALGYEAQRELDRGSAHNRLRWAVTRLAKQARLSEREQDVLALVLQGRINAEIGEDLGITKATVKWHMHNIFTKTGAATREALLREALQLGGVARRPTVRGDELAHSSTTAPQVESESEDVELEIEVDDELEIEIDDELEIEIDARDVDEP